MLIKVKTFTVSQARPSMCVSSVAGIVVKPGKISAKFIPIKYNLPCKSVSIGYLYLLDPSMYYLFNKLLLDPIHKINRRK